MSDAIFIANKASGHLAIGDKKEMDKATWRKPRYIRLTPTLPFLAPNGHAAAVAACPLSRDEQTWLGRCTKSENDPGCVKTGCM
jgi:hypothetical protein